MRCVAAVTFYPAGRFALNWARVYEVETGRQWEWGRRGRLNRGVREVW